MTSPSESSETTPEQVEQPEKPLLDRLKARRDLALVARRAAHEAALAVRVEQITYAAELGEVLRGKWIRFTGRLYEESTLFQDGYALDDSRRHVEDLIAFVTYVADGFADRSLEINPVLYINRGGEYLPGCKAAVRLFDLESLEILPEKPAEE